MSFFFLRTYPRACDLAQGSSADIAFSEPTLLFSTRLKIFFPALRAVCSDPSHTSSVDQSQSQIWRCHENFDRLLKSVTVSAPAPPLLGGEPYSTHLFLPPERERILGEASTDSFHFQPNPLTHQANIGEDMVVFF